MVKVILALHDEQFVVIQYIFMVNLDIHRHLALHPSLSPVNSRSAGSSFHSVTAIAYQLR